MVQYAVTPRGTRLVPEQGMDITNAVVLQQEGYVVFIDEQPKYDWAHNCQIAFIPATAGQPEVIFRGVAFPQFSLRTPDGTRVTAWNKF